MSPRDVLTLEVRSIERVRPGNAVQVDRTCTQSLEVCKFVLEDGADWIVSDILVDGRSQFAQPGDLPGDMFSADVPDGFVSFETIRAGSEVRVHAVYVGYDPEGRPFRGEFRGVAPLNLVN